MKYSKCVFLVVSFLYEFFFCLFFIFLCRFVFFLKNDQKKEKIPDIALRNIYLRLCYCVIMRKNYLRLMKDLFTHQYKFYGVFWKLLLTYTDEPPLLY